MNENVIVVRTRVANCASLCTFVYVVEIICFCNKNKTKKRKKTTTKLDDNLKGD